MTLSEKRRNTIRGLLECSLEDAAILEQAILRASFFATLAAALFAPPVTPLLGPPIVGDATPAPRPWRDAVRIIYDDPTGEPVPLARLQAMSEWLRSSGTICPGPHYMSERVYRALTAR